MAGNGATATLAAPITTTTGLSFTITSPTSFAANMVVQVDNEQMLICTYSYPTVTICSGGRGFGGTTAATHLVTHVVANYVFSQYHNGMSTELQAVEQWLHGTALPWWLNIVTYGGVPNSSSTCNDTAIASANTAAVISGSPTRLIFPPGTWYVCSMHNPPPAVVYSGVGQWSQEPEFGTVVNTVLKAASTFSTGTSLQNQFVVFLGGSGTDNYGSGVENMSIDGSGIADGIYVGHVNEHTHINYVDVLNFPNFGLYFCGADNGASPCTWGGRSGESGAQGDGPYTNMQFAPNSSYGSTAATIPIFINNHPNDREIANVSIVPSGTELNTGIVMWGLRDNLRNIHGENMHTLLTLSPPVGSLCPANCNGSIADTFDTLDLSNGAGTTYVVDIQTANAQALTFLNISDNGNTTCKIHYSLFSGSVTGCLTNYITWFLIDSTGSRRASKTASPHRLRTFGTGRAISNFHPALLITTGSRALGRHTATPLRSNTIAEISP